ncbi:MAG: integral rane protein MviN [Marmoricola sp.]|nr:integral rane protein MviN [Marmoricola sp.]
MDRQPSVLSSSAVMAVGTVFSRASGLLRGLLLAAALGTQLHADGFNIANTIPNMLYILLAGGVFNAVLVPQLVRSMKFDEDGGEAYTNRIITLAGVFLAGVTAVLVIAAPLIMRLYLDPSYFHGGLDGQRDSVIAFARLCLPQVFFYGMFVLVGQVLNARGKFGPMMWAPIANNAISVVVLVIYLVSFGAARNLCDHAGLPTLAALNGPNSTLGGFSAGQEWVLGLGSTLGIAVQFLILIPYLRAAGFTFRPRFDFRGTGLGHTMRLGTWTVLFVVVNQIAYTVVVRLASKGTAHAVSAVCSTAHADPGTGYTIYSGAFLLIMVPHGIATVSLATATLPRLSAAAAAGDLRRLGRDVSSTLRTTLALILPFAALLPVVALPLTNLVYGYGASKNTASDYALSLALFAPGLLFFTTHYLVLRGFYALERTRTVFWVQCVIAAVNIVVAIVVTSNTSPQHTAPGLVVAYGTSYLVGAVCSYGLLRRIVGGLDTAVLIRFLVRMVIAVAVATLAAWGSRELIEHFWAPGDGKLQALVTLGVPGVVDVAIFVVLARALQITEVTEVTALLGSRLPRRLRGSRR